jgi:hypothetical protein
MGDAGIDEQKPSVADDDADVLVVERIAADEDAIAELARLVAGTLHADRCYDSAN